MEAFIKSNTIDLCLSNKQSAGDVLCLTACIESLMTLYPNTYRIMVDTSCNAVFENNPHITQMNKDDCKVIEMNYPLIHSSGKIGIHFIEAFCDYLGKQLNIELPCVVNKPFIYLSDEERQWMSVIEELTGQKKAWVVSSGIKSDYTVKGWGYHNYQTVINHFKNKILFVQVGESHHNHKKLDNVLDLIGKTDTRQLIRLIYHSQGVLCGVSFLHHLANSFEKPNVTIASSMESLRWERYSTGVFLQTTQLPCANKGNGCWKTKITSNNPDETCLLPVLSKEEFIPKCMDMIIPKTVIEEIEKYYESGMLDF